jgi:predicted Zn-dependent protease with MMP-like domain
MPDTLGLYEGIPLTERDSYDMVLPDRITLFKGPIERICSTEKEIENEVRLTVRHEVGHFFGMDEDQLEHI